MRLRRVLLSRSLQLVPVALAVVVLNFLLIHLAPGDVSILLAGENADPAYLAMVRERYGLDRPFLEQLWVYLRQVATGDLGLSFRSRQPVLGEILERVPATLLLVGTSLFLSVVLGTLIGAAIARRPGSWLDSAVSALSVALFSVPVFWLGLMLILLLSVQVPLFPTMGMTTPGATAGGLSRAADVAWHLVLPVLSLMTISVGQYVRLARTAVAEAMTEPYVATARAIGFPERDVLLRHALPNAALPIVTVLGLQVGLLLTGAVLTETVFSWPGLGRMLYDAILARDTPVILGTFIAMSATVALSSLATDLAYAALDPRVRL
ncbi:ABC transporter permease [Roseomonas sp. OT10]|uniref:ABC transporter permease n=1 Tax=Roseomonas cutis TaxID=2897332 RepID=UPI001E425303|nr:ABC transporter permease [Roseomonas sp. OT10]UFN47230.1 ABC transporter permease [Roseomonas sp. OT10]